MSKDLIKTLAVLLVFAAGTVFGCVVERLESGKCTIEQEISE